MTYRIQVGCGNKQGQWVRPYKDGSFEYVTYDQATVFPSRFAAEAALQTRWIKDKNAPMSYSGDFKIVESPASVFAKIESTPGGAPLASYLFVGGPVDGQRLVVPDGSSSYAVAYMPKTRVALGLPTSIGNINVGRANYWRLNIDTQTLGCPKGPMHTVYVFSNIAGLVPEHGADITFEGRGWTLDDIRFDASWGGAWFRAFAGNYQHTLRLEARLADLVYNWALESWTFKPGATVTVNEERIVVVA